MISSILEQALIALPLILGAYLSLSLLKLPDFSLESAYLMGAVGAYLASDLPLSFIILSAIGSALLSGLLVSFLSQILHLPFLLAAIVSNGFFHGLTQFLLKTSLVTFRLQIPDLYLHAGIALVLIALFILLMRSQLGFSFAVYGNNPQFFKNHRLSGRYVVFSGTLLAHACAGTSGFLFAQSNGFLDLTMQFGIILLCLTSLMLGKLLIKSYRPNFLVPIFGIIFFFFIQQTLLRTGLNLKYFNAFQALFILAILYFGQSKQRLNHLGV